MSSYVGQVSADGMWRWDGESWQPIDSGTLPRPGPSWVNLDLRSAPTWLTLAGALIVGLIADQALRIGTFGRSSIQTSPSTSRALPVPGREATS
jgi:hypothetical protein